MTYHLSLRERFESRIVEMSDGCWNWAGKTTNADIGVISIHGRCHSPQAAAYLLDKGHLPPAHAGIKRLCGNRICCNPRHFEIVKRGHHHPKSTEQISHWFFKSLAKEGAGGCWIWKGLLNTSGYGRTTVNGKRTSTHRLAWMLANGPIPKGLCVCHKCDNPPCCNPEHLFLGTVLENAIDCKSKGRLKHRICGRGRKLSEADVQQIRNRHVKRHNTKQLAAEFGISTFHLLGIVNFRERLLVLDPLRQRIHGEAQ